MCVFEKATARSIWFERFAITAPLRLSTLPPGNRSRLTFFINMSKFCEPQPKELLIRSSSIGGLAPYLWL